MLFEQIFAFEMHFTGKMYEQFKEMSKILHPMLLLSTQKDEQPK